MRPAPFTGPQTALRHWPQAVVHCDSEVPTPPVGAADDTRRFRLSRPGLPDQILGVGGFGEARTALAQLSSSRPE